MGLLEKAEENMKVAQKCLEIKAYNAGISRAYYAAFQRVEYALQSYPVFDYEGFLADNKISVDHIPHGKMQQAMFLFALRRGKKANLGEMGVYDNLYRKRRLADYTNRMLTETALMESIEEMKRIFTLVA